MERPRFPERPAAGLSLTNVQPGDGGNYQVRVGNAAGQTNSAVAVLTVMPLPPGNTGLVLGVPPIAYWRLDESSQPTIVDIWGGHDGVASGGVAFGQPGALLGDPDTSIGFDGSSAKINVPYSLTSIRAFSPSSAGRT